VKIRNVISAVEVVVDKDLPVAMNVVSATVEVVELADSERGDTLDEPAKKFIQRNRVGIEVYKDEAFPCLNANGQEAVLRAIEVLDTLELGHAF
jgi:hypothetical protein